MSNRVTKGHEVPKPMTFQAIHDAVRLARDQGMKRKDLLYWMTECWRIHGRADRAIQGPPCGCGEPNAPGIEHRRGASCYVLPTSSPQSESGR